MALRSLQPGSGPAWVCGVRCCRARRRRGDDGCLWCCGFRPASVKEEVVSVHDCGRKQSRGGCWWVGERGHIWARGSSGTPQGVGVPGFRASAGQVLLASVTSWINPSAFETTLWRDRVSERRWNSRRVEGCDGAREATQLAAARLH